VARGWRWQTLAALAGAAALSACSEPLQGEGTLFWQSSIRSPLGSELPLEGSVAMVANTGNTQIGIGVRFVGLDAQSSATSFAWLVFEGNCISPGDPVVAPSLFPALTPDSEGEAEAELVVNRRLDGARPYAVRVQRATGSGGPDDSPDPDDPSTWLACTALPRTT
jgi:hypothetical protein